MVTCSLLNVAIDDDKNKTAIVDAGVPLLVQLLQRHVQFNEHWKFWSLEENKSRESQLKGITLTGLDGSGEGEPTGCEGVKEPGEATENVDVMRNSPLDQVPKEATEDIPGLQQLLKQAKENTRRLEQSLMAAKEIEKVLIICSKAKLNEPLESLLAAEAAALDAENARVRIEAVVAALLTLSSLGDTMAYIGYPSSGAIPPLVKLLRSGSKQARRDALTTLLNLDNTFGKYVPSEEEASIDEVLYVNRMRMVRAGAIPILLYRLHRRLGTKSPSKETVASSEKAMALLYALATTDEGLSLIAKSSNGIADLVRIFCIGSAKEKEYAVSNLSLLSTESLRYSLRNNMMNDGPVMHALVSLSVAETSTPEAKRLALTLLTHFCEQCEELTTQLSGPQASSSPSKRNSHEG
ncbi:hypothetical protein M758_8G124900 [Ceratodon purpureus]|nr:hypothetical protein M758_8G124900 [Ceratodon purpureus]